MDVSVIVCTRNRARQLVDCLDAVAAAIARVPSANVEFITVDNGSTDETPQVLDRWRAEILPSLRVIREDRPGLSRARNTGVRAAQGRLVVFTDDDCRLDPTYLIDLLAHDACDGDDLVLRGGRVELGDPRDQPFTILTSNVARRYHKASAPAIGVDLAGLILGCNMSCRRDLFERVGLFDERFGVGGPMRAGEDSDFLFRAYLAGAIVEYVPDMLIRHFHGRREASDILRLLVGYDEGAGATCAKFWSRDPALCRQALWDVANMVREWFGRAPSLNFGHTYAARVRSMLRGAARYWLKDASALGRYREPRLDTSGRADPPGPSKGSLPPEPKVAVSSLIA